MRYRISRLLQLAGLIILPQGIVLNLMERVSLGRSLLIALVGCAVFMVGLSLQRSSAG